MTPEHRPDILQVVWAERDAWAREARQSKSKQELARKAALYLGVGGACLGAIASVLDAGIMGFISAFLLAFGVYLSRQLLTPERETHWTNSRLLAEGLGRECWRYTMRVPPYHDEKTAAMTLSATVESMLKKRGTTRQSATAGDGFPHVTSIDQYIDGRVLQQAAWYERKLQEHRSERDRLYQVMFGLGFVSIVLGLVGSQLPPALSFVPVVTTTTTSLLIWTQSRHLDALLPLYQETGTALRLQAARWRAEEPARLRLTEEERRTAQYQLVERCEEIMARENGAWRVEWLCNERAQQTMEEFHHKAVGAGQGRPEISSD